MSPFADAACVGWSSGLFMARSHVQECHIDSSCGYGIGTEEADGMQVPLDVAWLVLKWNWL